MGRMVKQNCGGGWWLLRSEILTKSVTDENQELKHKMEIKMELINYYL